MTLLDPDNGLITQLIYNLTGERVMVLTSTKWFVPMLIVTDIYKGMGWYCAGRAGTMPWRTASRTDRSPPTCSLPDYTGYNP